MNCFINKTVISGKKFPTFSVTVKNPILPTYRPTCWSTHHRRVGRHTTNASADTLSTCRPTHYTDTWADTTGTWADTLPTRRSTHCRLVGRHAGRHTTDPSIVILTYPTCYAEMVADPSVGSDSLPLPNFRYILQGCPLSQEFRKILFHSPPEISEKANGNCWSNVKSP